MGLGRVRPPLAFDERLRLGSGDGEQRKPGSISCPSATWCVAVGSYQDTPGYSWGMSETLSGDRGATPQRSLPRRTGRVMGSGTKTSRTRCHAPQLRPAQRSAGTRTPMAPVGVRRCAERRHLVGDSRCGAVGCCIGGKQRDTPCRLFRVRRTVSVPLLAPTSIRVPISLGTRLPRHRIAQLNRHDVIRCRPPTALRHGHRHAGRWKWRKYWQASVSLSGDVGSSTSFARCRDTNRGTGDVLGLGHCRRERDLHRK